MTSGNKTKPWQDEETLRRLYHDDQMSMQEIADHFDNEITGQGIKYWLEKLGIEKRSRSESAKIRWRNEPPSFRTHPFGYELVENRHNDELSTVSLHRLLAVHKYGFDAMRGKVVHHKNDIPWDNREENIELMTAAEHAVHHHHSDEQSEAPPSIFNN